MQQSDLRDPSQVPGTPPSQFPQFTPEGFRINAYNPSLNLGGSNQGGQGQGQGGQGSGGGGVGLYGKGNDGAGGVYVGAEDIPDKVDIAPTALSKLVSSVAFE